MCIPSLSAPVFSKIRDSGGVEQQITVTTVVLKSTGTGVYSGQQHGVIKRALHMEFKRYSLCRSNGYG